MCRKIGRVCILFCVFALSSSAVFTDTTQSKPSPSTSSSSKASSKYVKQPSNDVDRDKHPPSEESDTILLESCHNDVTCLLRASDDKQGLDAIRALHQQLDDDEDGDIDLSESKDFLREELKYEKDAERRQRAFHHNDMHISVKELWEAWIKSEVHNWTVEQTADWLATHVELPQYVPIFVFKRVTGAQLPRLATGNGQYLANVLGVKDPIHKQKIMLKAMDVVLFGPPKFENTGYTKDLVFVSLLLSVSIGFYYVYRQSKNSKEDLHRMMKHMDSLQKADSELKDLQEELERAKKQQQMVAIENQNLERRLRQQLADGSEIGSNRDLEVAHLREEIEELKNALQQAEGELVDKYRSTPLSLQPWLQFTYEIHSKAYAAKKAVAERQIDAAKEACEKLRKKRSSLIGAFISTHGKSIDDVDKSIMDARTSLSEVTAELQERVYRWQQIEQISGFSIVNNKGLSHLEEKLYKNSINGRNLGFKGCVNGQDNPEDDTSSNYSAPTGISFTDRTAFENFNAWNEGLETSDSEKLENDYENESLPSNVHFMLGSTEAEENIRETISPQILHSALGSSNRSIKCNRIPSKSFEHRNGLASDSNASKSSATSLPDDMMAARIQKMIRPPRRNDLIHSASLPAAIDDEMCVKDTNDLQVTASEASIVSPVESKKSKIRQKLFPKFGRKVAKNTAPLHAHSE